MANQVSQMDVQFSPFPSGFCPQDLNDLGQALANRLIVTPGFGFSGINIGPTAPDNTDLPWFNTTQNDWYYWSTVAGQWLPVRPVSITGEVQVGSWMMWDGLISQVASVWGDRWLFANGQAVSRTEYSQYFAQIGTKWGIGDGATTFNIADLRNVFWGGAEVDDSGEAKSTMSDGSALTKERAYTSHVHGLGASSVVGQGHTAGNSYVGIELDPASDSSGTVPTRVLPPYKIGVPIVRVK